MNPRAHADQQFDRALVLASQCRLQRCKFGFRIDSVDRFRVGDERFRN